MGESAISERANALRSLHKPGAGMIVPNAWDAASAIALSEAGFQTMATTSAGVAWAAGYGDGQKLPYSELLRIVASVTRSVAVPVSVDAEGGYLAASGGIERTVEDLVEAGAAGLNLEDGALENPDDGPLRAAEDHAETIAGARATADRLDVPLFVNGRTDMFWRRVGEDEKRVDEAIRRLRLYVEAGADCVFAPGLSEPDQIRAVAEAIPAPLNLMLSEGMPSIEELRKLGVARVTVGAGLFLAAVGTVERLGQALASGDLTAIGQSEMPGPEVLGRFLSRM